MTSSVGVLDLGLEVEAPSSQSYAGREIHSASSKGVELAVGGRRSVAPGSKGRPAAMTMAVFVAQASQEWWFMYAG